MQLWMALHFALALFVAISCLLLIINKLHIIQRAEQKAWKKEFLQHIQQM